MEDTAPVDAAFCAQGREKSSQWPVRAETTDVLYASVECETPNAAVAAPYSPDPRGAVAARPVMSLDHQHLAPATGKQGTRRQSSNPGSDDHDVVVMVVVRPSTKIRHVPGRGVAADGGNCYHTPGYQPHGCQCQRIFTRRVFVRPAASPVGAIGMRRIRLVSAWNLRFAPSSPAEIITARWGRSAPHSAPMD